MPELLGPTDASTPVDEGSCALLCGPSTSVDGSQEDGSSTSVDEPERDALPLLWQSDEGWFVTKDVDGRLLLVITPAAAKAMVQQALDDCGDVLGDLERTKDVSSPALEHAAEHLRETAPDDEFLWVSDRLGADVRVVAEACWPKFVRAYENVVTALADITESRKRRRSQTRKHEEEDWKRVYSAFSSLFEPAWDLTWDEELIDFYFDEDGLITPARRRAATPGVAEYASQFWRPAAPGRGGSGKAAREPPGQKKRRGGDQGWKRKG